LEKRAVLLSGIPLKYWETFQLTHYTAGQQYRPHFDWFDESDNNRAATIFVYLNSVELDGATEFPRLGLSVQPKEGNALMWYNCSARGNSVECDVNTEHAGRPPRSGEKFALNCWARTRPYRGA
jgi:prolyl 4-hydroxylase